MTEDKQKGNRVCAPWWDETSWNAMYQRFAAAIAYVWVQTKTGDHSIGTAFHVGEGIFVTARHVVEGNKILEIRTTVRSQLLGPEKEDGLRDELEYYWPSKGRLVGQPMFHPDDTVDIAVLRVEGISAPAIPLGSHLDDWFGQELVLQEALVLGYPQIPTSKVPILLASQAEVNAVLEGPERYPRHRHPHFILSCTARGGFSGGPALARPGWVLGVITESLGRADLPLEAGFLTALTVEPIYDCLAAHRVMPAVVREPWQFDDGTTIWDTRTPERIRADDDDHYESPTPDPDDDVPF